jgi:hypothetical protein
MKQVLKYINLNTINFSGLTVLICGKVSKKPRARYISIVKDAAARFFTYDLRVVYGFRTCVSSFGVYGIKI